MGRKAKHTGRKKKHQRKLGRTILAVILGLFAAGLVAACIMIGITALRVGEINKDTLYDNIEKTSYLYDINGEQIDTLH